uniref:Double-stranded RNA-specific editase 1-like n=1 Tax=Phallusia mammillata TaxID=59560 RepID=A0A6F9D6L5_9ASCI|nr:double-stranded RNA-specific editase 1-like [Phallusia mammillata]
MFRTFQHIRFLSKRFISPQIKSTSQERATCLNYQKPTFVRLFCTIMDIESMKVVELRAYLKSKNLSTKGNKEELQLRAMSFASDKSQTEDASLDRNDNSENAMSVASEIPETASKEPEISAENLNPVKEAIDTNNGNFIKPEVADVEMSEFENERKRKGDDFYPGQKKVAKWLPNTKSPLMLLNEMKPGTTIRVSAISSPGNNPRFKATAEVNGQQFCAEGNNKKEAKQTLAALILQELHYQFASPVIPFYNPSPIDFTSDDIEFPIMPQPRLYSSGPTSPVMFDSSPPAPLTPPPPPPPFVAMETSTSPKPKKKSVNTAEGRNPVSVLNEMLPGIPFKCIEEVGIKQEKTFTMEVEVNGKKYQGYGKNKKLAKLGVATKVLQEEFGVSTQAGDQRSVSSNMITDACVEESAGNLPDLVYSLVREKFSDLTDNFSSEFSKHKVLAGIVMTRENGPNVTDGEVISVATGTKCVKGEFISNQGAALFDCHAEIVSRRGFRRFMYQQLIEYEKNKSTSILEHTGSGRFKLKSDVFFHLYISTSPCGDARLFSPHETEESSDNHPNRRSRGQLRTKIENGEGTIPVVDEGFVKEHGRSNVQQTWDGIISGERLLTMSCSDKIAKWNVVGIQGSLLSLFIEPVYLSSIVLGSLYHAQHLERGVFSRASDAMRAALQETDDMDKLFPQNYRMHRPLLASVSSSGRRMAKKAPNFCFHWTSGDPTHSIINTGTGRADDGPSSNLCKKEMMKMFMDVCENNSSIVKPDSFDQKTYGELKNLASGYQELKYQVMGGFTKTNCGRWIGKPNEVDMFTYQPKK